MQRGKNSIARHQNLFQRFVLEVFKVRIAPALEPTAYIADRVTGLRPLLRHLEPAVQIPAALAHEGHMAVVNALAGIVGVTGLIERPVDAGLEVEVAAIGTVRSVNPRKR